MIKWGSYDLLCKYYEKIPESEKEMYNFDDFLFQNKYIFLAQLECFYKYITFVNDHFSIIFSLSIKQEPHKITNIKNSIYIKSNTFLNKMRFFFLLFVIIWKPRESFLFVMNLYIQSRELKID